MWDTQTVLEDNLEDVGKLTQVGILELWKVDSDKVPPLIRVVLH